MVDSLEPDEPTSPKVRGRDSGLLWFALSIGCLFSGVSLAGWAAGHYLDSAPGTILGLMGGLCLILVAGGAAWRLARTGSYSWLLPLAAICLLLLQPGRAGDIRTWRLEWGVMGLAWTIAAVIVFVRLLRRSDELEQRLHLEGAFLGLCVGLVGSVVYALFENRLPVLRGQWIAVALLLSWWVGYLVTARRYRWRA